MTANPHSPNQVAIACKDTLLQIWDVSLQSTKPHWQARNLPNDELDLQIPIFDNELCFLDANHLVATTAYGDIREYDIRGQRRPVIHTSLEKEKTLLGKVVGSLTQENVVYTVNQEGHIYMLDRKKNYQIIKKLMGNRGSVRALAAFT